MPAALNPIDKNEIGKKGKTLDLTTSERALDFDITTALSAPVNAHILDPVDAHNASAISVLDDTEYFSGSNVETVTQQLGDTLGFNTSGILSGCTFTDLGFDITLDVGSSVRLYGQYNDVSGQIVTLDPSTSDQYVYIDFTSRTLVKSIVIPPLSDGNVLLWKFNTDGSGITEYFDYRYFVTNSDRKDTIVVRSSTTGYDGTSDEKAEGHFNSLLAALNYLSLRVTDGSETKSEIILRGEHTISSPVTIPIDNITLRGEGAATIVTGDTNIKMFDVSGRGNIVFKNLTFRSEHTLCVAIEDTSDSVDDLVIDSCSFTGVGDLWNTCINLKTTASSCARPKIINSYFNPFSVGISISRPDHVLISGCTFEDVASGTTAISIGVSATAITLGESVSSITNCTFTGFSNSCIYLKGDDNKISNVSHTGTGSGYGIQIDGARNLVENSSFKDLNVGIYTKTTATETLISNVSIRDFDTKGVYILGANTLLTNSIINTGETGLLGIHVDADDALISNTMVINSTTIWTVQTPIGVFVANPKTKVVGCTIQGWYNTGTPYGFGVYLTSGAGEIEILDSAILSCYIGVSSNASYTYEGISVKNCNFTTCNLNSILLNRVTDCSISGNRFYNSGSVSNIEVTYGENINISDNTINCLAVSPIGIKVSGTDASGQRVYKVIISNNNISRVASYGIYISVFVRGIVITGNSIDGYLGGTSNVTAQGIYLDQAQDVLVNSNTIWRCKNGILLVGTTSATLVENISCIGNTIHNLAQATTPTETFDTEGTKGIGVVWGSNIQIKDNNIYNIGTLITDAKVGFQPSGADVYSFGIYFVNSYFVKCEGNKIHTLTVKGAGTSKAIAFEHWNTSTAQTFENIKVCSNSINSAMVGVYYRVGVGTGTPNTSIVKGCEISYNNISNISSYGIQVYTTSTVTYASAFTQGSISNNRLDTISNNAIMCEAASYGSLYDISIKNNDINVVANLDAIHIASLSANTITYGQFYIQGNTLKGTNSTTGSGIKIDSDSDSWSVANISHNNINGFVYAIYANTTTSGSISKLSISNNMCIDVDLIGVYVNALTSCDYLTISGNTVLGKTTNCTNLIKFNTAGVGNNVIINSNTLHFCSVSAILISPSSLTRSIILGNNITSDGTNVNEIGIEINTTSTTSAIENCNISNNIFGVLGGYAVKVYSTAIGDIANLAIVNNNIYSVGTGSTSWSAIKVESEATRVRELDISNNQIKSSNTTGTSEGSIRVTLTGTNITCDRWKLNGNVLYSNYGTGIYLSSDDCSSFDNVQINHNELSNLSQKGIYVLIADSSITKTGTISNQSCIGNLISDSTSDGINYDFSGMNGLKSVNIANNQCYSNSDSGITIAPPFGDTVGSSDSYDIIITGNTCKENDDYGIWYNAENFDNSHDINYLTVSNNLCNDNGKSGIYIHHSPDTGHSSNLNITGNTCVSNGAAALDCGIYLSLRGNGSENLIVSNNIMTSNYDVGFRIYTGIVNEADGGAVLTGASVGTILSVMWLGNMARDNSTGTANEDVSSGGTNWPPTLGNNISNIDSGSGGGQWIDHDGAGWTIDNNTSIV